MKPLSLHVVLVEPEIPQNTGNIVRTCAAVGAELHLIEPLGFSISDRYLKRAGLDYWSSVTVRTHGSFSDYLTDHPRRAIVYTSKRATLHHTSLRYPDSCALVFGKETEGLPRELIEGHEDRTVRIPMIGGIRSLNLSNAVAIVVYEAFRQHDFAGLE
jgi:tRNA (cytidine/uridine-2'-O-)-methyltransferase